VFWDKVQVMENYSDGELAWTSFKNVAKIFKQTATQTERIHPTQKPIYLYKWLLDKYANPNDKILDTHLGSMSIAIACHDYGFELTGCELDPEYYQQGIKRVQNHLLQRKLF
jgi:site-specific DNA-methyltransferase (adenine-specific)